MQAIMSTCDEIVNDDTAGDILKRVIKESGAVAILLCEMFTDGMIDSASPMKQEFVDFVDYLMNFCTKFVLESNNVNSIVDCFLLIVILFRSREMNQCCLLFLLSFR